MRGMHPCKHKHTRAHLEDEVGLPQLRLQVAQVQPGLAAVKHSWVGLLRVGQYDEPHRVCI